MGSDEPKGIVSLDQYHDLEIQLQLASEECFELKRQLAEANNTILLQSTEQGKLLSGHGMVRLAEDQTLPNCPYTGCQDYAGVGVATQSAKQKAWKRCQDEMLEARWRKVILPEGK